MRISKGLSRWATSVAWVGIVVAVPSLAAAAADVSPRYQAWAKFKPGSSATLAGDVAAGGATVHFVQVRTLTEVTPETVTVSVTKTVTFMGHDRTLPATTESIPATDAGQEMKPAGTADVTAMGRTFACKVYEATGAAAAAVTPPSAAPGARPPADTKVTLDVCDEVPGGLVKMESTDATGNSVTLTLTAMTVK